MTESEDGRGAWRSLRSGLFWIPPFYWSCADIDPGRTGDADANFTNRKAVRRKTPSVLEAEQPTSGDPSLGSLVSGAWDPQTFVDPEVVTDTRELDGRVKSERIPDPTFPSSDTLLLEATRPQSEYDIAPFGFIAE